MLRMDNLLMLHFPLRTAAPLTVDTDFPCVQTWLGCVDPDPAGTFLQFLQTFAILQIAVPAHFNRSVHLECASMGSSECPDCYDNSTCYGCVFTFKRLLRRGRNYHFSCLVTEEFRTDFEMFDEPLWRIICFWLALIFMCLVPFCGLYMWLHVKLSRVSKSLVNRIKDFFNKKQFRKRTVGPACVSVKRRPVRKSRVRRMQSSKVVLLNVRPLHSIPTIS